MKKLKNILILISILFIFLPFNVYAAESEIDGNEKQNLDNYVSFDSAFLSINDCITLNINVSFAEGSGLENMAKIIYRIEDGTEVTVNPEADKFSIPISFDAKDIDKTVYIKAIVPNAFGVDSSSIKQFSVNKYCDEIINLNSNSKLVNLAKAIKDYGLNAKNYFSNQTGVSLKNNSGTIKDLVEDYKSDIKKNDSEELKVKSASLSLEDKVTLNFIFEGNKLDNISNYHFYAYKNNQSIDCSLEGNYLKIKNIKAYDLLAKYSLIVKDANSNMVVDIEYSPMSYVYDALNYNWTSTNLKNLACSLYEYGYAASNW